MAKISIHTAKQERTARVSIHQNTLHENIYCEVSPNSQISQAKFNLCVTTITGNCMLTANIALIYSPPFIFHSSITIGMFLFLSQPLSPTWPRHCHPVFMAWPSWTFGDSLSWLTLLTPTAFSITPPPPISPWLLLWSDIPALPCPAQCPYKDKNMATRASPVTRLWVDIISQQINSINEQDSKYTQLISKMIIRTVPWGGVGWGWGLEGTWLDRI